MELSECLAGLNDEDISFIAGTDRVLTGRSYVLKMTNKEGVTKLAYSDPVAKRALLNIKISGSAVKVHIYGDNIRRYIDEIASFPEKMVSAIRGCRKCAGADRHQNCIGGYSFVMDDTEHLKCRYFNFVFDVNDDTRSYITEMILKELSCRP
ncbi:MAG: hypothetical protein LBV13_06015 [Methanomassiliicoccaceae archaeon]|jgi:hypothetical protein|nr:hypothetical protein [Methanomassiliicoccaceae archaeon]